MKIDEFVTKFTKKPGYYHPPGLKNRTRAQDSLSQLQARHRPTEGQVEGPPNQHSATSPGQVEVPTS